MATLEVEMARAKENGDQKVSGFTGAVRSLENPGLEEGDTWVMPSDPDVYKQKLGDNSVEYIWITLENGNAKKFYPSTFTKSRSIYEDGVNGSLPKNTGVRVHTKGNAAALFQGCSTIAEGMKKLAGRKMKVSKIDIVKTLRFNTSVTQNTQIPTIDFVD